MYSSSFRKFNVIIACCQNIYGRSCFKKKKITMISSTHNLPLSSFKIFLLSRMNKLDREFLHWQNLTRETTWHRFYPISSYARAKIAGMVNEVYFFTILHKNSLNRAYLISANTELTVGCCWESWIDCSMFDISGDVHRLSWLCLSVSLAATNQIKINVRGMHKKGW